MEFNRYKRILFRLIIEIIVPVKGVSRELREYARDMHNRLLEGFDKSTFYIMYTYIYITTYNMCVYMCEDEYFYEDVFWSHSPSV